MYNSTDDIYIFRQFLNIMRQYTRLFRHKPLIVECYLYILNSTFQISFYFQVVPGFPTEFGVGSVFKEVRGYVVPKEPHEGGFGPSSRADH